MAATNALKVMELVAAGREWDMNQAAAIQNLDAATSAERESRELREARSTVAELVEAAEAFVNDDRQRAWHPAYWPMMDRLREAVAGVKGGVP